jgi:hypothetical protein
MIDCKGVRYRRGGIVLALLLLLLLVLASSPPAFAQETGDANAGRRLAEP